VPPDDEKRRGKGPESFEDLMASAEAVVKKLEGGQLSLEESVAEWQKGMDLLKRSEELLASAERKIEILARGAGGEPTTVPFEDEPGGGSEPPLADAPRIPRPRPKAPPG